MAGVREAEGDVEVAVDLLDEAERLYVADFLPPVRPVPAVRARTWARHGYVDAARDWADQVDLSLDDPLSYLREFEHVTLAKVLSARHARGADGVDLRRAVVFLDRLLEAATEGGRDGSVLEIQVTRALVLQQLGDQAAALASLGAALELAEPEGYVRTFVDEGGPMATLLAAGAARLVVRRTPPLGPRRVRRHVVALRNGCEAPRATPRDARRPAQQPREGRAPPPRTPSSTARTSPASSWSR